MEVENYNMAKKFLYLAVFIILSDFSQAYALSNSADAFMSLPFGHSFARTQKRMTNSGATVLTPRQTTLSMEGFFEGFPARFIFGFHKKKGLKSKALYVQSSGNAAQDQFLYTSLQKAYNAQFGSGRESPIQNPRAAGKIMLRNIWTPDRYTTITLTYNPEATNRFPTSAMSDRPVQLVYKYDKWD